MMLTNKLRSFWLRIKFSCKVRQLFAAISVSHGSMTIGTTIGWFSHALETLLTDPNFSLISSNEIKYMILVVIVGALISLVPSAYSTYKFGRIWTCRFLALISLLGWILIAVATNIELILIGRFCLGISTGGFSIVVPLYLIEISQTKFRGSIGFMYTQQIYTGVLMAFFSARHDSWQMLTVQLAPLTVILFILTLFIPDTPIYYLKHGNFEKAQESLRWLRASQEDIDDELSKILELVQNKGSKPSTSYNNEITFRSMLTQKPYKSIFWTTLLLITLQACTTLNPFIFYTTWIKVLAGDGSRLSSSSVALIITFIALLGMGIISNLSDKFSRRKMLNVSCAMMVLGFGSLGSIYFIDPNGQRFYWVQFVGMCLLIFGYICGFLSIPYILMVEGAHPKFSEIIVGTISACQLLIILLLSVSMDHLLHVVGIGPLFWICSFICFACLLISFYDVPETHGKSLNEIQMIQNNNNKSNVESSSNNGISFSQVIDTTSTPI